MTLMDDFTKSHPNLVMTFDPCWTAGRQWTPLTGFSLKYISLRGRTRICCPLLSWCPGTRRLRCPTIDVDRRYPPKGDKPPDGEAKS